MKKIVFLFAILLCSISASALDIPAGTFYFDNSLTQYSNVKFVYGRDDSKETYVVSMTKDEGSLWKITFSNAVTNMYRYTFAATTLPDGKINNTFSNVKDSISNKLNEKRTATTSATIIVGGIYTPTTGDNWAQGAWKTNGSKSYSGTLPVMYINTENKASIVSKDTYINGNYYIDNLGIEGYESIGRADSTLALQIKGHGNYTWTGFNKKPYRIKLDKKAALLGMKKDKNFVLLAHADDNLAFLRNTVGFELSRRLGLPWTPSQEPVEVVLNGDYIGLYLLTENIRVDKDRVNIVEQPDSATDANVITGGWLVEIDNYQEASQVRITEGNGASIWFTYKSPEVLSPEQKNYLTAQVTTMNSAIYNTDKTSTAWENIIDLDDLVRYYIVQEVMDNEESFHGSCYLYKDQSSAKWFFGPVWDFGNSYHSGSLHFIYVNPPFGQTWIGEIAKYPRFQQKVKEIWQQFKGNDYATLDSFIDTFISKISTAAQYDAIRWPDYGNADINNRKLQFKSKLTERVNWLIQQWGEGVTAVQSIADNSTININSASAGRISITSDRSIRRVSVYDLTGRLISASAVNASSYNIDVAKGIYIVDAVLSNNSHKRVKIIVR